MRLTGIIDYTMDNFLCVRGFASMLELAEISEADKNIQRDLIKGHKGEMEAFLSDGRFTFFPEVILCANMNGSEENNDKINILREAVRAENALRTTTINNIKYSVKRNAVKKENNDLAFDVTLTIIMEFDKSLIAEKKFLRIDGNHRLSAVNPDSSYASKRIPYCLLLFRDNFETDKFCRALFYNINAKQIPLKMEQTLRVIIESEQTFDDEILKEAFGFNYYLTRRIIKKIELSDFPFVKMFIEKSKYTYFVEVIKLLLDNKLIEENEESADKISDKIPQINDALHFAAIENVPKNVEIIGAYTYYLADKNKENKNKADKFLKWVNKNKLMDIAELHMKDVIDIFDKIYNNLPKKIFMSMEFAKKTEDTYKEVKDVRDIMLRKYNVEIEVIRVDEHKDGYSDLINNRIIAGIDDCDLLIADLTYGNKNVHHEIGYAQGKGKKVLLLYHIRDGISPSDEIGSNLSMHDQIRFYNNTELRSCLLEKLKDYFLKGKLF